MDDVPPLNVYELLRVHDIRPNRRLGQNFLIDESHLKTIVRAAEITSSHAVLEIGPGLGSLTRYLVRNAGRVVAVEIDARLAAVLRSTLSGFKNLKIVQGDILTQDIGALMDSETYIVVANIPYNITSLLIRHLLEAPRPPEWIVLTVQREVAERICASAGDMNLLALSVGVYGNARIVARVPAGAFHPIPKVDSAVVRIDLDQTPRIPKPLREHLFRLAKAGFSQKRKTLRNSVSGGMRWSKKETEIALQDSGIDPDRRAETLSLEEWLFFARTTLPMTG
jgi:16S rRNA (adenine1518-N6/adenine1519-N6)-dimethyltransferase